MSDSLYDTIKKMWDKFAGGNPKDKDMDKQKANAEDVPLGTGAADQAKKKVSGRQKQIDDAVKAAGG